MANEVGPWVTNAAVSPALSAQVVWVLSALLGAVMMVGLAASLPAALVGPVPAEAEAGAPSPLPGHPFALLWLSATVMFVLAGFELGIVLQGQQQAGQSSRQAAIRLAECSLFMLGVNALLFITSLLEKVSARVLMGAGLLLAVVGLAMLAVGRADAWMYLGVVMGGLTAAAGLGQTLGSATGGWLFGMLADRGYALLALPLLVMLGLLLARPAWWSLAATAAPAPTAATAAITHRSRQRA